MTEFLSNLLVFPFIFTLCLGLAGGIMQGFNGWGGAMLMMPLITLVYTPAEALALLVVGGLIMSAQLYPRALKEVTWDSMRPMLLALIIFTPAVSIFSQAASSIISDFLIITSPVKGFFTSFAATLPRDLSDKLTMIFPPSRTSVSLIEPQSFLSHLTFVIVKS